MGDVIQLRDKNGQFPAKIVHIGTKEECKIKSNELEKQIRHERDESTYCGSDQSHSEDDENENEEPVKSSDTEEHEENGVEEVQSEILKEKDRFKSALPSTLPGFSTSVDFSQIGYNTTPPNKQKPSKSKPDASNHPIQKQTGDQNTKRNWSGGACAFPDELIRRASDARPKSISFDIQQNGFDTGRARTDSSTPKGSSKTRIVDNSELLTLILSEQRKTNKLLESFLKEKKSECHSKELPAGNYVLANGIDLSKIQRPINAQKYAITLAKEIWTKEELLDGLIDPQPGKTKKRKLDGEKVELMRGLIQHFFPSKNDEKVWSRCRKSVNQMATDQKKRTKDDASLSGDETDDFQPA
ncbi:uncharacterized protein [Clytia hemisphaerica]|uniref:uncharacterized protein isoform X2 n=1 Tax=Clytia hemisphaerica TaxID=252671 RepID=UPI0034D48607